MASETSKPRKPASPVKTAYLVLYNFVSAVLWATVLGRTALLAPTGGPYIVWQAAGTFTRWTQTLALLELVHALTGIVRASFFQTFLQVASRLAVVWGAVYFFPLAADSGFYPVMLLAWSVTEIIRYTYFALLSAGIEWPGLTWLKYSTFFPLYPVGITCECVTIWKASMLARELNETYAWVFWAILLVYVPGTPFLYGHVWAQRSKVLGKKKNAPEGKKTK